MKILQNDDDYKTRPVELIGAILQLWKGELD